MSGSILVLCPGHCLQHTKSAVREDRIPTLGNGPGFLFASSILFLILKREEKNKDSNWFVYCLLVGEPLPGSFEHNTPSLLL